MLTKTNINAISCCLIFALALLVQVSVAQPQNTRQVDPPLAVASALEAKLQMEEAVPAVAKATARQSAVKMHSLSFYQDRSFRPIWLDAQGKLLPEVTELVQYVAGARFPRSLGSERLQQLLTQHHWASQGLRGHVLTVNLLSELELALTRTFLKTAWVNAHGYITPEDLPNRGSWFVKGRELHIDHALNRLAEGKRLTELLEGLKPQDPNYSLLNEYLAHYRKLQAQGGWPLVPVEITKVEIGDTSEWVPVLRKRLAVTEDLPKALLQGDVYDDQLVTAVQSFQARHGLDTDGRVGTNTLRAMNIPVEDRIRQLSVNMERAKWLPDLSTYTIWVNIPAYELYFKQNGQVIQQHRVVVGSKRNRSIAFSSHIENFVLNPFWNVPVSITRGELAPQASNNADYLSSKNYEVIADGGLTVQPEEVDWNDPSAIRQYRIRQRPGAGNALGFIKFNLPNQWSIYLHDTPSRHAFSHDYRALSHGCIRVQHPEKLAARIAEVDGQPLTEEDIKALIAKKDTRTLRVKQRIDVHLVYMTAWVGENGEIQFREDIYERDKVFDQALSRLS